MAVNLELTLDQIREAASKLDPSELDSLTYDLSVMNAHRKGRGPGGAEAKLIMQINDGLPERTWAEYFDLRNRRESTQGLAEVELTRLLELSDAIERKHATRMLALAELAAIRRVPLRRLIRQLGIRPQQHA